MSILRGLLSQRVTSECGLRHTNCPLHRLFGLAVDRVRWVTWAAVTLGACRKTPEGTPHATVVTAAVLPHPGADPVVLVSPSATVKLADLRADPTITLAIRAGWQ